MRKYRLPGNKRGPGAMDVYRARDGQPWVMRRRPQGEMDALVTAAGFTKRRQWVDDFGIFTVSAAQKPANP